MIKRKYPPNFDNLLQVLNKQNPTHPTLFEFFMAESIFEQLAGFKPKGTSVVDYFEMIIQGFFNAGYDYCTVLSWKTNTLDFPKGNFNKELTRSQNEGYLITDWESFEKYEWPNINDYDYSLFESIGKFLPEGMKLIAHGPGGVLENATDIVGYENLCYITMMDEDLAKVIFDAIGSRLLQHYEIISSFSNVGAVIGNDDWGFKTQTMFPTDTLQKYVFPWHKKIVGEIHKNKKPAILHSCGNLSEVMNDVIFDMKYDGKHSYEDQIIPVEEAYQKWGKDIAILGGIDLDFICRSTPEDIFKRSVKMLEISENKGAYALGSGNSIPDYVPLENYFAMLNAINYK